MIVDHMNGLRETIQRLEDPASAPQRYGRFRPAALALLALGLAAGCGTTRPINYYQLSVSQAVAPATTQPLPVTIIIALPASPDLYRDNRLVYAVGEQKIGAYESERWIGPPPELIRDVLLRNLRASGRYEGVYTPQGKAGGDYLLRTRIYDFKEQDSGSSLTGRLTLEAELQNTKTGDTVWQTFYNHDEPISAKTVPDVVAALNTNVQMAASNIASGMDQYFAAHPPK
jgi:cholesterol transport system auxiliary component